MPTCLAHDHQQSGGGTQKTQSPGLQEGKERKQQEQRPKGDVQKRQERGLEERFLAKTKGGSDPDAAFESRLEEMKRKAQVALKVGALTEQ